MTVTVIVPAASDAVILKLTLSVCLTYVLGHAGFNSHLHHTALERTSLAWTLSDPHTKLEFSSN